LKTITTVYSYRSPKVRQAIDRVYKEGFPHHVLMGGIMPPGALDGFSQLMVQRILAFHQKDVPGLAGFNHRYVTAGSEPGIMESFTLLRQKGVSSIYVRKGEYEGYKAVAETRGIGIVEVERKTDPASVAPGYWYLSNPSAINGNIIPEEEIEAVCEAGHQVFYDLAYLDSTRPHEFDVRHPNIFAAVVSFSKTYGMFYDRIGAVFSREPIPSLYGTRWFYNPEAVLKANAVLGSLQPNELYSVYRPGQEAIIDEINREYGLGMRPSDTFLLGHLTADDAKKLNAEQLALIARHKRADSYRFCLTPYYLERDPEEREMLLKWRDYLLAEAEGILTPQQMDELKKMIKGVLEQ